jgi:hypothetical protein
LAQVQRFPFPDRLAEHGAFVPAVGRDEFIRVAGKLRVVGVAVVGDLDRRHDRADRLLDAFPVEGGVGHRQVLADLDADLEFHDQSHVVRGPDLRRRAADQRAQDDPGLGRVDTDEAPHFGEESAIL